MWGAGRVCAMLRPLCVSAAVSAAVLSACAAGDDRLVPPRHKATKSSQGQLVKRIEQLFEVGGEGYDAAIAEACLDPAVAEKVTMLMVMHLQDAAARQHKRQVGQPQVRSLQDNQRYQLARETLSTMGLAAVPTVINELLLNRRKTVHVLTIRKIGVRVLGMMPPVVVPAIQQAFADNKSIYRP